MTFKQIIIPPSRDPILRDGQQFPRRDSAPGRSPVDSVQHTSSWRRFHERTAEQINETAPLAESTATDWADYKLFLNLIGSFVTGCTITAHDNGSDATITVSDHLRAYHSGAVSVTGGTTTAAWGATVFIYYDDPTQAGGAVTYANDTFFATAFSTASHTHHHFVGSVICPNSGDPDTNGVSVKPPGYIEP